MYAGRLVEEGRTADLFRAPRHPYTAHLIASLPRIGDTAPKAGLDGAPPNLADPPPGCRFHPRCPLRHRHLPPRGAAARAAGARPSRRLLPSDGAGRMSAPLLELDPCEPHLSAAACSRAGRSSAVERRQPAARGGAAGDLHHRRRIGQRQDHARPHDPEHGAAQRRHDPLPGHRPRDHPRQRGAARLHAQGPADLPEPVRGLQSAEARRPLPVRRPRGAWRASQATRRSPRPPDAALQERRPVAGRGARPLPARAVGRPAAARGDRAGADLRSPRCSSPTSRCR